MIAATIDSWTTELNEFSEGSRFNYKLREEGRGRYILDASGKAGQFAFRCHPVHLVASPADSGANVFLEAALKLERRLLAQADRFHGFVPFPVWTARQTPPTAIEKVEKAFFEYQGSRLEAITLGRSDWLKLIAELGQWPAPDGDIILQDFRVREGSGIAYVIRPTDARDERPAVQ
jgi:hypothetical protein